MLAIIVVLLDTATAESFESVGCFGARLARGGIAQLGERLHGMQEVSGSIPLTSTIHQVGAVQETENRRFSPLRLEA